MPKSKTSSARKGSDKDLPTPTVVIPTATGRVEVSVENGRIWLSDYANGSKRNYTLVIPRRKLRSQASACQQVQGLLEKQEKQKSVPGATARSRAMTTKAKAATPPRVAGYWYETNELPFHGRPLIIIE